MKSIIAAAVVVATVDAVAKTGAPKTSLLGGMQKITPMHVIDDVVSFNLVKPTAVPIASAIKTQTERLGSKLHLTPQSTPFPKVLDALNLENGFAKIDGAFDRIVPKHSTFAPKGVIGQFQGKLEDVLNLQMPLKTHSTFAPKFVVGAFADSLETFQEKAEDLLMFPKSRSSTKVPKSILGDIHEQAEELLSFPLKGRSSTKLPKSIVGLAEGMFEDVQEKFEGLLPFSAGKSSTKVPKSLLADFHQQAEELLMFPKARSSTHVPKSIIGFAQGEFQEMFENVQEKVEDVLPFSFSKSSTKVPRSIFAEFHEQAEDLLAFPKARSSTKVPKTLIGEFQAKIEDVENKVEDILSFPVSRSSTKVPKTLPLLGEFQEKVEDLIAFPKAHGSTRVPKMPLAALAERLDETFDFPLLETAVTRHGSTKAPMFGLGAFADHVADEFERVLDFEGLEGLVKPARGSTKAPKPFFVAPLEGLHEKVEEALAFNPVA